MFRYCLSILILTLISTSSIACLRGAKETEIIKVSLEKIPEQADGVLFVATNEKVEVGIEGKSILTKMDICGNYILNKDELKFFVDIARKYRKISDCKTIEEVRKIINE